MQRPRSIAPRAGSVFAVVATALLAAALSHVALDALGDVVLAHDAYDDVAHNGRSVAAGIAGAGFLAAAARSAYDAVLSGLGRRAACRAFQIASPPRFCAAIIAIAMAFVLTMETLDAAVAGHPVTDVDDLFGGSIALGIGTTIAVTLAVALAAVAALRFFCTTSTLLMRVVSGFFQPRGRGSIQALSALARRRTPIFVRLVVRRHAAKRGPPDPLVLIAFFR
jgi:hypothetical protein